MLIQTSCLVIFLVLTHSEGGRSTKVLLYLMKQPVLSTDKMKSDEVVSTYRPAPSSVAKLLVNLTAAPS